MLHLVSAAVFSVTLTVSLALIAAMLRGEWRRISAILSGGELTAARAHAPAVRVRLRAWRRVEARAFAPARHAAAA